MQEENPEVLKRAQRHTVILYGVMILMVLLPLLLLWLKRRGVFH